MIRDPSDGAVRILSETVENKGLEPVLCTEKPASGSGLPATSTKLDYLERLEASREWLKTYQKTCQAAQSRETAVNE